MYDAAYRQRPGVKERIRAYKETYWKQNKSRLSSYMRGYNLMMKYGLTVEQWRELWQRQNCACAICARALPDETKAHTDHDHKTGRVRGILCSRCNTGLGWLEDGQNLAQALNYLENKDADES